MRILDWECTINHDGTVRAAQHAENGSVMWSHKSLMGSAGVPPEVLEWLIRPLLRDAWNAGAWSETVRSLPGNPYEGEPPNKDKDPS